MSNTSEAHWSKENKWRPFKFLKGTSYGKWHAGSDGSFIIRKNNEWYSQLSYTLLI